MEDVLTKNCGSAILPHPSGPICDSTSALPCILGPPYERAHTYFLHCPLALSQTCWVSAIALLGNKDLFPVPCGCLV